MKTFDFSLPGQMIGRLETASQIKLQNHDLLLLQAYVPGIELMTKPGKQKPTFTLKHVESKNKKFSQKNFRMTLADQWKNKLPLDFFHLFYSASRLAFINKKVYPVHSACIAGKKNLLLVGHTGNGKTSLVLKLLQDKKVKIISGNKTLVTFDRQNNLIAVAGTKTITAREIDLKKYRKLRSEIIKYAGSRSAFQLPPTDYFSTPTNIDAIAIIRLNDGVKELTKKDGVGALHALYPFFLDSVNADTVLLNGQAVFSGAISIPESNSLSKNLGLATAEIPVFLISGSLNFISQSLLNL